MTLFVVVGTNPFSVPKRIESMTLKELADYFVEGDERKSFIEEHSAGEKKSNRRRHPEPPTFADKRERTQFRHGAIRLHSRLYRFMNEMRMTGRDKGPLLTLRKKGAPRSWTDRQCQRVYEIAEKYGVAA
jgi:hypothetical protein